MALAMVGEALISASVDILLNRIASKEFRDFFSSTNLNVSLLDELRIKLLALNVVLNDAEEKQITDLAVKAWFDELKDAVYNAEDLLDQIDTKSLRRKLEGESKTFTRKVRSVFSSSSNQFHRSMNPKLEAISRRLEHFVKQKDILGLQSVSRRVSYRTATDSLVESVVVAREGDKEKLLKMLLSDNGDENNNIEVISILGMGGLGKTTLAQALYNDSEVQKHFDLSAWAWVSDDFDVFRVPKKIFESLASKDCSLTNLDVLRVELGNTLREKKFLLVLDDLWNEKYNDWHHLITPFSSGKKGSKIIVTTRQHRVAQVTHTFPICELEPLTDVNCWHILARHAFGNEVYNKFPSLEEIGRKIAKKCNGLPLAAKTLGGLLRSNIDAGEWDRILNSNLWAHEDVLPALRISYLHLPAFMKRCFAYCSIFPRQQSLDRKELILLWMAEGFLQQFHGEKEMEVVGAECFEELLSRSLIEKDKAEAKDKFRMHDLIYDLARLVSGKSSCNFEDGEIPGTVRHLAYLTQLRDPSRRFEGLHKVNCLRTFQSRPSHPGVLSYFLGKTVSHMWLPKLRCLRILSLSGYKNIRELSDSIDNLVLLRYLDLSYTSIKRLPDATCRLYNLQTLKLSNCKFLVQLSRKIENLVNLRHLDISDTGLEEMPEEICKLQDLRALTSFIVGKQDGLRIMELRRFPYLQGKLAILGLQNVDDPMDACLANLKEKEKIEELMLAWGSDTQDSIFVKDVLENLQTSTNLKKLNIKSYGGTTFPKWLGDSSYSNVTVLGISDCNYCPSLPPLGQLPSLKELVIKRMKMVNTIGHEFYCNQLEAKSVDLQWNSSVEEIYIEKGRENLLPIMILCANCLRKLTLKKISSLLSFPVNGLPTSLQYLRIEDCENLEFLSHETWHKYTSLEYLYIWDSCYSLSFFPLDCFPALKDLSIRNCPSLEAITIQGGGDAPNLYYFSVTGCEKLSSLPEQIILHALEDLELRDLPQLVSFSARSLPSSLKSLVVDVGVLSCMSKDELGLLFQRLTSLSYLHLYKGCGEEEDLVNTLLKKKLLPTSLTDLYLWDFSGLKLLEGKGLQHLTSLQALGMRNCESLESLPEDQLPSSLEKLMIGRCPLLEGRYKSGKGKYRSKIAHIPTIILNWKEVIIR